MKLNVETLVEDGLMAVAVSHNYGAGWGTWEGMELAVDKRVIEVIQHFQENKINFEEAKKAIDYFYPHKNIYYGGFDDIKIEWVPLGEMFRINEYDGLESIVIFRDDSWIIAGENV